MGITFPFRLQDETGASMSDIATAQQISLTIYDAHTTLKLIHSLDGKINIKNQYELLHQVRMLLNMATRWFLRSGRLNNNLVQISYEYRESIKTLANIIPNLIVGSTKEYLNTTKMQFIEAGLSTDLATRVATSRVMYPALNIIEVSKIHRFDLIKTAKLYFQVGGDFNLVWFRDYFARDNKPDKCSSVARLILRDYLDTLQRRLVIVIMQSDSSETDVKKLVRNWIDDHAVIYDRWNQIQKSVRESTLTDYTMLFIALHELGDMIDTTTNNERSKLLAYHDALTLLPNRFAIMDKVEQMQFRAQRDNNMFAIHIFDLDKFKVINDTHGHHIGDKLLIEVTNRLLKAVTASDMVARMSGDEFIILQPDITNPNDAATLSSKMLTCISEPIYIDNLRLCISASSGIAIYPLHGTSSNELLAKADKAMYSSKANGRGQVKVYESA